MNAFSNARKMLILGASVLALSFTSEFSRAHDQDAVTDAEDGISVTSEFSRAQDQDAVTDAEDGISDSCQAVQDDQPVLDVEAGGGQGLHQLHIGPFLNRSDAEATAITWRNLGWNTQVYYVHANPDHRGWILHVSRND